MASAWKTRKADDEECPKCKTVFEVAVTALPARDSDYFDCSNCGFRMSEWNGAFSKSYSRKLNDKQII